MLARRPGASSAQPVVLYDEEGRKKKAVQRYAGTLLFVSVIVGLVLLMLAKYRQEMQFSSAGTSLRYSLGPVETYNEIFETRGRMFNKANAVRQHRSLTRTRRIAEIHSVRACVRACVL